MRDTKLTFKGFANLTPGHISSQSITDDVGILESD